MTGFRWLVTGWQADAGADLAVLGPDELRAAVEPLRGAPGRHARFATGDALQGDEGPALLVAPPPELWAGVDEAGRGPLAGPVVACALVLPPGRVTAGLRDSKALTPRQRQVLFHRVLEQALDVRVAVASHQMVDRLNVLQASLRAMAAAVSALSVGFHRLVVDGPRAVPLDRSVAQQPMVDADARVACVAAASVVAKVVRDALMEELDRAYPGYGFARHKGYPTPEHLAALRTLGPSPVHRRSFGPVAQAERRLA